MSFTKSSFQRSEEPKGTRFCARLAAVALTANKKRNSIGVGFKAKRRSMSDSRLETLDVSYCAYGSIRLSMRRGKGKRGARTDRRLISMAQKSCKL